VILLTLFLQDKTISCILRPKPLIIVPEVPRDEEQQQDHKFQTPIQKRSNVETMMTVINKHTVG